VSSAYLFIRLLVWTVFSFNMAMTKFTGSRTEPLTMLAFMNAVAEIETLYLCYVVFDYLGRQLQTQTSIDNSANCSARWACLIISKALVKSRAIKWI